MSVAVTWPVRQPLRGNAHPASMSSTLAARPAQSTQLPKSPVPKTSAAVLVRLHAEWNRLVIRSSELETVRGWCLPGGHVASLDDVLARSGFVAGQGPQQRSGSHDAGSGDASGASADQYLLQLIEVARDDELAARVVLQRILPPLCAVARRHSTTHRERHDLLDELVANSWALIRRYPTQRRRRHVAANLVRDITFETIVRPRRRRGAHEIPTDSVAFAEMTHDDTLEPLDELVALLHDARRATGVDNGDVAFICQLINHGRPENMATALDVTPRTVRNHRDAVLHRLRSALASAA